jgi:hypothetical protein
MKVKRISSSSKPIKTYTTKYLWCCDGWTYDTVNQTRRQFFVDGEFFHSIEESYNGAYPSILYSEDVVISKLCEKPLSWSETVEGNVECFVEVTE